MNSAIDSFVLKGGHVLDAEQGIDKIADVHVAGGKIQHVGSREAAPGAKVIDVSGSYVSAGWVDIHVHAYGTLGFANPDLVGVYQGVTSFVDAGGPGIGVLDQFMELLGHLETSLYAGAFIRPMGLLGLNFIEGNVRTLGEVPITRWIDFAKQNRDMLRYIKCNAMGDYGPGTLKLTKGLAEILNLPLYMHIGEFQMQNPEHLLAPEAFRIAEAGDMITHLYHGNLGQVIGDGGKVLPVVRDAQRRGVIFDLGFGGYNFSWAVAEKAFAQDLIPHTISSDLQQFNVVRPVKSLANVMSAMLHLGLTLPQVIERVTCNAAKAIKLTDRAGSLKPGLPADITVFRVNSGEYEISDCYTQSRKAEKEIQPLITFKKGKRFDVNMTMGQDESNWFLQIAEEQIPDRAARLSERQRGFLNALADKLSSTSWETSSAERLDIEKALELQDMFYEQRASHDLPLKDALHAVYASFLDQSFTMQIGLLLVRLEQPFAISRLRDVSSKRPLAA
jgi:dihydroorotase